MSERLRITMEIDHVPDGQFLDFRLVIMRDGWLTRLFHDWKRVTYERLNITKMDVLKDAAP